MGTASVGEDEVQETDSAGGRGQRVGSVPPEMVRTVSVMCILPEYKRGDSVQNH